MTRLTWQPEGSEAIEAKDLKVRLAREFADYVRKGHADFAKFIECRKNGDHEIVSFSLQIEIPQRPEYPFHDHETVSVLFMDNGLAPVILVARADFPDTPHQSLVARGFPYQLCVDDRPWEDVKSAYTASEILQRVASWFARATQGELHDARQPLDPTIFGNSFEIVFRLAAEDENSENHDLAVYRYDDDARYLFVEPRSSGKEHKTAASFNLVRCVLNPTHMKRMRHAPADLRELANLLTSGGCDLPSKVKQTIDAWQGSEEQAHHQNAPFCFLVTMPILHPESGDTGAVSTVAFVTDRSAGEVGEVLGLLFRNERDVRPTAAFSRKLFATPNLEKADLVRLFPGIVHRDFDCAAAAVYSGRTTPMAERVLLVGAGSLGSAIAEALVREGLFKWTILDDDVLLPHNLSRHTLNAGAMGQLKARMLARRLHMIRHDTDPRAIVANLFDAERSDEVNQAFDDADFVIDASASVPAARAISDWASKARRISAFFTPDGGLPS
ncbi:ThiF family adenylyltransferase [Roseibium album]|uniref:Thiamine biosynthesis protein ThiF n=1 Tax=Roseibium album TaxID=311410 RepID=A0A0M7A2B9_9HYPH|nr:ThiF family adenylyltransferase [Roseibium album]CTQ62803.1 thiamine biosynthesis protein ThiF [Roseibium album]CTQ68737.1 thiamine biosynthesis protein ThiF [Roseibium album]CTQ80387.1 thiamine biosynthesis protein ThiF [Roseibium album]